MKIHIRIIALCLALCSLAVLVPDFRAEAARVEPIVVPAATSSRAEQEATATALKAEITSLAAAKNRNGRVRLTDFTKSADGSTDMISLSGQYYLIRKQGEVFYALDGGWTGPEGDLPTAEVVPSDTTNFHYISSGLSTAMLFTFSPIGAADNGMPAYKLRFADGNNVAVGSKITGTTNLYYVKSTAPARADKIRIDHADNATYFCISNLEGTHGFRMSGTNNAFRWKDNSEGDNNFGGTGLLLYRYWSTQDLRAAIDEVKHFLDSPAFYKSADYEAFLTCLRESIDLFNKYNSVPKTLIEPYDNIQNRLNNKAAELRGYLDSLKFTIEGLPQAETNATTIIYQLPCKQPGVEDNMSYIIQTRKGKIIIIDGGWQMDGYDGKYLFSYLREITGDNTPHVTAWFFTHAHGDHIGAVGTIAELYADKITVDAFYQHNLTEDEVSEYLSALDSTSTNGSMRFVRVTMRKFKNSQGGAVKEVEVNSIHSGECNSTFDFDEVHIDILQTFTDVAALVDSSNTRYTGTLANHGSKFENMTLKELLADNLNDTSVVFRVTVGGKSILFTGDCAFVGTASLMLNHSRNQSDPDSYFTLKSDYVQVAHHGIAGLTKKAYQTIDPDYAMWPVGEEAWNCSESSNPWVYYCKQWFSEMETMSYAAYAGPQKFRFPVIRSEKAVSIPAALKPYVFDAKYYADHNADLKKAYGYDEETLYWHFVNFGIEEGRCASPFFDVKFYMNQNGQNFLYNYKGDYEKAFKHFLSNYKSTTLMQLSPIFDAAVYASMYPQLAEDGIDTQFELLTHYAEKNYPRGRIATATYPSADGTTTHSACIVTQGLLPNCSAEGRTARIKCSTCLAVLQESTTLEMLPHSYGKGRVTKEPTCVEEGVMTYICSGCSDTKTEIIPLTGHSPETDAAVEPSCSKEGLTEGSHCSVCQVVLTVQEKIPTVPHSYETFVTKPNCTTGGYTTYTCTACGHSYSGDETEMLGHAEVVDEGIAPTCTENGLTDGKHCEICGEILAAQNEIPATGHSYSLVPVAPTCTERGYDFHFCACGDSYMDNEIAALGHDYAYDDNGGDTHTGTCFCGDAITESHNYVDGVCICGAVEITEPILDSSLTFGAQLYLENDLTMAFRVKQDKLNAYDISTAYLVVERDVYESGAKEAVAETITISDYQIENGRLIFSYPGIAAAQMNDAIRATFHIKNAQGQEYVSPVLNTSVATYLDGLLSASASDTKMVTLIMDMLNYGAAAQVYFDRHADAPVNEAFESFKTYASYASADFRTALENLSATENAEGKNGKLNLGLDLGTRIGIQYKVTVPSDVNAEDVTLVITDAEGNVLENLEVAGNETDSRGRYLVNFYGFTSRDMRRVVYATAYANGEAITGTYAYSISTYAWGVQENASLQPTELVSVTRAMMLYGDSAAAYFTG